MYWSCSFFLSIGHTKFMNLFSEVTFLFEPEFNFCFIFWLFQALRKRAKKARAVRKPHLDMKPGVVIENVTQTRQLAETTLGTSVLLPSSSVLEEGPTNTGSGSQVRRDFCLCFFLECETNNLIYILLTWKTAERQMKLLYLHVNHWKRLCHRYRLNQIRYYGEALWYTSSSVHIVFGLWQLSGNPKE